MYGCVSIYIFMHANIKRWAIKYLSAMLLPPFLLRFRACKTLCSNRPLKRHWTWVAQRPTDERTPQLAANEIATCGHATVYAHLLHTLHTCGMCVRVCRTLRTQVFNCLELALQAVPNKEVNNLPLWHATVLTALMCVLAAAINSQTGCWLCHSWQTIASSGGKMKRNKSNRR